MKQQLIVNKIFINLPLSLLSYNMFYRLFFVVVKIFLFIFKKQICSSEISLFFSDGKDQKYFVMLVTKSYKNVIYAIDQLQSSVTKVLDKSEEEELIIDRECKHVVCCCSREDR